MREIIDINNDGLIDWRDYLFYGVTVIGNIIFTVFNILK